MYDRSYGTSRIQMNPFEFVSSINFTKKDIMIDDVAEHSYNSFMVNRSLSYFNDTVCLANVMNQYHHIDNKLQYHFLINIIRKRKRFSKWIKPDLDSDTEVVKQYYGYSNEKAFQALKILTPEQINFIKQRLDIGGRK